MTAEILEKKKSLQQHWIVFLMESVVQLLDESMKLLVDGSAFAPIGDMEIQNERFLQSDLLKSGVCTEVNKMQKCCSCYKTLWIRQNPQVQRR